MSKNSVAFGRLGKLASAFVSFSVSLTLVASCANKSEYEQIDQSLREFSDSGHFNGSILVAKGGKVVYDKAIGFADFSEGKPLGTGSVFYLASLSKQFTAMGIMMLEEQKKISYDQTLESYFPDLPPDAQKVTVRNLLNHTSGLADYFDSDGFVRPGLTNQDVYSWLTRQHLNFEPGSEYRYSNSGYVLLSLLIEKVSKQPFSVYMRENIFAPAGMVNTLVLDNPSTEIGGLAKGYDENKDPDGYDILTSGDGGIFSTIHDLFAWDRALYGNSLVSETTLDEAFSAAKLDDGTYSDYGFGWNVVEGGDGQIAYHTGELDGYQTFTWIDRKSRSAIVFLTNQGKSLEMWPIADRIRDILSL